MSVNVTVSVTLSFIVTAVEIIRVLIHKGSAVCGSKFMLSLLRLLEEQVGGSMFLLSVFKIFSVERTQNVSGAGIAKINTTFTLKWKFALQMIVVQE